MLPDDPDASSKPTTPVPPEQRSEAHTDQEEVVPGATLASAALDAPNVEIPPEQSPAEVRFKKCRFYTANDNRTYCSNRDVLPYAGKNGFSAEAWCLECTLYKLRRTPKKRSDFDDDYSY